MTAAPRSVLAPNPGPFTLDGTRTYLVGRERVVVIDPGPDVREHVRALASMVARADSVTIVLTHGHRDHAEAARPLSTATGAPVLGPAGLDGLDGEIREGVGLPSDEGELIPVHTPGHSREHHCLHMPSRRALFAGDHLLGKGDTTWVADYPGCVADYLASLDKLRALDLEVVYPAHGPALVDPADALDRFEAHRRRRIQQVRTALEAEPGADLEAVLEAVYGSGMPERMRPAARKSLEALVAHVRDPAG